MTRKLTVIAFSFIFAFFATASLNGCSSKSKKTDGESIPSAVDPDESMYGDSDSGNGMGLKTVNFEYDSYALSPSSERKLKDNADVLKSNKNLTIQIEGHCDEHGSIQYNLALGEKRANAARKMLVSQGISSDRITIISYGKERPLNPAHNEEAWSQNRRANFVITSK